MTDGTRGCRFLLWSAFVFASAYGTVALARPAPNWVRAWAADPADPSGPEYSNATLRQFFRISQAGTTLRVRLSNELGHAPLHIADAGVALPGAKPGSIAPGTSFPLSFAGRRDVTLPPGTALVSDPVPMPVKALASIAVSLYLPKDTRVATSHQLARDTTWLARGDETATVALTSPQALDARFVVTGVDVDAAPGSGAVVALGDSTTDGDGSTVGANRRWPDQLAERIVAAGVPLAVVDAGIAGNRLLRDATAPGFGPSAQARFGRDVLSVPGVRTVIVYESINDIGLPGALDKPDQAASADDIIAGMRQLIARAHARHLRIIGATLTPCADAAFPNYYSAAGEAKRQAVNRWIREAHAFDGVADFDAVVRDPARPEHLRSAFDSGDHLHPNDTGYRAMAAAVDLRLLR